MAELIVVAPTHREGLAWCDQNGVTPQTALLITSGRDAYRLQGQHGTPHIITRWTNFTPEDRDEIIGHLQLIESPPYGDVPPEPEDDDELRSWRPAAVRA